MREQSQIWSGALEGDLGDLGRLEDCAFKHLERQGFHHLACNALDGVVAESALILLILGVADKTVALHTDSVTESGPCHIAGGTIVVVQQPPYRCVAGYLFG